MNIDYLVEGVKQAGDRLKATFYKGRFRPWQEVHPEAIEKTHRELVLKEDLICERILISNIKEKDSNAVIYSEEMNTLKMIENDTAATKYLIDPLDGSHNFRYGLPFWGVAASVLNELNIPIAAVIYMPMMNLLLKCESVNGASMVWDGSGWETVRTCQNTIEKSLVCYDNQFYKMGKRAVEIYKLLAKNCFTTRISGSAVCDSALIACGKINARIWNNTECYDIAAGIRIVEGAGGCVTNFSGDSINIMSRDVIMCSNGALKKQLLELIEKAKHRNATQLD